MLKQLIESETRESITLRNRIAIEVHTASFRSTRGYTIIAALLDEVAYWPTDEASAEPDIEVINAVRPGMATIADAMLLCASSRMPARAPFGPPTRSTSARRTIRSWCGRHRPAT